MTQFLSSLAGPAAGAWDFSKAPDLPAKQVRIAVPPGAKELPRGWELAGTSAMFAAGDDLVVITKPGPPSTVIYSHLYIAPLVMNESSSLKYTPVEFDWPKPVPDQEGHPSFTTFLVWQQKEGTTVWLGTERHGLARFDKQGGRWKLGAGIPRAMACQRAACGT